MKHTFLKTIGLPIISEQAGGAVALMKEPLVNPEDGGILAVSLVGSKKVVAMHDIRKWDLNGIKINDETVIIDPAELIKLSQFSKDELKLFGKVVVNEDGEYLGLVHDFVFDPNVGQLVSLYVVKKFLVFFTIEKRIIDYREIVEIRDEELIVNNNLKGEKESVQEFFRLREKVNIKMPKRA